VLKYLLGYPDVKNYDGFLDRVGQPRPRANRARCGVIKGERDAKRNGAARRGTIGAGEIASKGWDIGITSYKLGGR